MQEYLFKFLQNRLSRPLMPVDYILTTIIFSGTIAWLTTDPTILYSEGGVRVLLIRLSWFFGLLVINNITWIFITLVQAALTSRLNKGSFRPSVPLFVFSHILSSLTLASNFFHYLLFREHWNYDTIINAYDGIMAGQAPMDISLVQVTALLGFVTLFLLTCLFIIRIFLPVISIHQRVSHQYFGALVIATLVLLSGIQHTIKPNWHSVQLQKAIPWFQFIQTEIKYNVEEMELKNFRDSRRNRATKLSQIPAKLASMPVNLLANNQWNVLIIHIEALRSDMVNEENMPNLYHFGTHRGEILEHHYTSSNNTVGGMFGLVTGFSGAYYPHFRDNPFVPATITIFQRLGYELSIFNSVPNTYQNAEVILFGDFKKFEMSSEFDIPHRDRKLINTFVKTLQLEKNHQRRFDYVVLNSTHFPYEYPSIFKKYTPVLENIGMSSIDTDRKRLEENKLYLKNRYLNSVFYVDSLLGDLFSALEGTEYFEKTAIFIVGDHGQEFWEHNRFGHNFGFVNEQVQVAGVVKFPGGINTHYRYTSHIDFMTTVIDELGLSYTLDGLMDGKNLKKYQPEKDFITVSMGVVNKQKHKDELVVGDGIKVHYTINNGIKIENVSTTGDEEIIDFEKNKQKVYNLIRKSLINTADYPR